MNKSIFIYIIIVLTFLVNIFSFKQGHDWGGDFAHYIEQSKSLLESNITEFKEAYTFTYNESIHKPGPIFAPWGFPVMLLPILSIFGINILVIKIYSFTFFLLSLILIYFNFKGKIKDPFLIIILAIIAFHPTFFDFKENIQTDYANLFISYLSLFLIRKWVYEESYFVSKSTSLILLGIVLYVSFFIKTIGITLLLTSVSIHIIKIIIKRQYTVRYIYSNLSISLPYLVFILLFVIDYFIFPSSHSTYNLASERSFIKSIFVNASVYLENIYNFLSILPQNNLVFKLLNVIIFITSLFFAGICLFKNFSKDLVYILFTFFVFIIILPLPFNGGGFRYIIPIFPIYLYFSFKGFQLLLISINSINGKALLFKSIYILSSVIIIYMLYSSIIKSVYNYQEKPIIDGPYTDTSQELFKYISDNTTESDIVVFFKPRVMNLYTNRKSFRIYGALNLDSETLTILEKKDWNYLITDREFDKDNISVKSPIEYIYGNEDFTIFKNINDNKN